MTRFPKGFFFASLVLAGLSATPSLAGPKIKDTKKITEEMLQHAEGGIHSGGGNVIAGYNVWGGAYMAVLADLYYAGAPRGDVEKVAFVSAERMADAIEAFIDFKEHGQGAAITAARKSLSFVHSSEDINRVFDDGIDNPGLMNTIVQLGKQDFDTRIVRVDDKLYSILPRTQQAFFLVHEGLIRLRHDQHLPPETNFEVRKKLAEVYLDPDLPKFLLFELSLSEKIKLRELRHWGLAWGLQAGLVETFGDDGRFLASQRFSPEAALKLVHSGRQADVVAELKKMGLELRGQFYFNVMQAAASWYHSMDFCQDQAAKKTGQINPEDFMERKGINAIIASGAWDLKGSLPELEKELTDHMCTLQGD